MKKQILTLIAAVFVTSFAFGQWTDVGGAITTPDNVRIFGNDLQVDTDLSRASFRLKADGGGVNQDDYFQFVMRNDVADVELKVIDDSEVGAANRQKKMLVFFYLQGVLDLQDNVLQNAKNIYSQEVNVKTSPFPDYVFEADYDVPTLEEEEAFIQENGHLLGFESAEEIGEDLPLGDVTVRQQEKIETMMLQMIEMNKRLKALEEENKALKEKLEQK